ncbi:hypothetical protein ACFV0C_36900 [Streptomyces sp. NPDC059568]|uniref:hypothetical protein n=1 Tax=Streptomyces sp. NPDC059568 TaxID=3346868 RepID=UPI0036A30222
MFGLTTTRRLRAAQHENLSLNIKLGFLQGLHDGASRRLWAAGAQRDENARLLIEAYAALDNEQDRGLRERIAYRRRLNRALHACARWRAEAARSRRETRLLAEQLLDATSGQNTAARTALGLHTDPWQRATDGLNALIDAGVPFHIEPDGHISNPSGNEHIEWDRATQRWRLVHDTDG